MAHRQRIALRVQIRAATKFTRLLLGVQGLAQRIDRLVEVSRCEVRGKGVHRAFGEGMAFARSDELADIAIHIGCLAQILLEGDARKGETSALKLSSLIF